MSEFPLNIEDKEDHPLKINTLSGLESKYYETASEKNKKTRALTELDVRAKSLENNQTVGLIGTVTPNTSGDNTGIPQIGGIDITLNGFYRVNTAGWYGTVEVTANDLAGNIATLEVRGLPSSPTYIVDYKDVGIPMNTGPFDPTNETEVAVQKTTADYVEKNLNTYGIYSKYTRGTTSYSQLNTEAVLDSDGDYFEATINIPDVSNEDGYVISRKPNVSTDIGIWTDGNLRIISPVGGTITLKALNEPIVDNETFKLKIAFETRDSVLKIVTYKNDTEQKVFNASELRITRLGDTNFAGSLADVKINDGTIYNIGSPVYSNLVANFNVTKNNLSNYDVELQKASNARELIDNDLQNYKNSNDNSLSTETTNRENADTLLQANIDVEKQRITDEETNREQGDSQTLSDANDYTDQEISTLSNQKIDNVQSSGTANRRFVINSDGSVTVAPELGHLNNVEFIDTADADVDKDTLRFTFVGGSTIDVDIKDLFDVGAFSNVDLKNNDEYILNFTTLGNTIIPVDLTPWFTKLKSELDVKIAKKLDVSQYQYTKYAGAGSYSQLIDENNVTTEITLGVLGDYVESTIIATNIANQGAYNILKRSNQSFTFGVWTNGNIYFQAASGFLSFSAFTQPIVEGEEFSFKISYENYQGNDRIVVYKNDVYQSDFPIEDFKINRIADANNESYIKDVVIKHGANTLVIGNPAISSDVQNFNITNEVVGFNKANAIEDLNKGLVSSELVYNYLLGYIKAEFDNKPTENSTKQVNSGNQFAYLNENFTKRNFFIEGVEPSYGTIDLAKGTNFYSQRGLGVKTLVSPTAGTYKFNAVDVALGTKKEKTDILVRVYTGNFAGSQPKNPSTRTRLSKDVNGTTVYAEKVIKNVPVNDTKIFTVVFNEIFEFTSAGSIDFLTVFAVGVDVDENGNYTQNGRGLLMPYHNSQNTENTRAGMYYQLGTEADYFNDDYNYSGGFLTNTLNFKIVQEVEQIEEEKPFIRIASKHIAVVGTQTNIYYDALVNGIDGGVNGLKDYYITIIGNKGKSFDRMWQYTPSGGDVGSETMIVQVYRDNKIVNTKSFELVTIVATAPSTVKEYIPIGDSNTDFAQLNAAKTQTTKDKFDALGGSIPLFRGSRDNGSGLKNEGKGGYSFESYATDWASGNPFWNNGAIDIANYKTTHGITNIDVVTISLLTNDANSFFGSGFQLYNVARENQIVQWAKNLIDAIIQGNSNSKIIINLPPLTGNTADGFGTNYGASDNQRFKNAVFALSERFLTEFDNGSYNANVTMANAGVTCDRYYGYARSAKQVATRIPINEDRHNNAFHPTTEGYQQLGDYEFGLVLNAINN